MKGTGLALRVVSASNAANCNNNGNANNNTANYANYVAAIIVCATKNLTQGLTIASRLVIGAQISTEDKERQSFGTSPQAWGIPVNTAGRRARIRLVVLSAPCTF